MLTDDKLKMATKIKKMLDLADGESGKPEGEAFRDKAYALMLEHNISEADARALRGSAPDPIEVVRVPLVGSYKREQAMLLQLISEAHGCAPIWMRDEDYTKVFGTAASLDTVRIIFRLLVAQMLAAGAHVEPSHYRISKVVARRSFMDGFCEEVGIRLQAMAEVLREKSGTGAELMLVTDADRARQELEKQHTVSSKRRRSLRDVGALDDGRYAGSRANIGQTGIDRRRRALSR